MPSLYRRPGEARERMGAEILEAIRRYSRRITADDADVIQTVIGRDVNGTVPGVIQPSPTQNYPPFDPQDLFNDDADDPHDVSDAPSDGVLDTAARLDHEHRGVRSIAKSGSVQLFKDVTLSEGSGIQITQVGQDIRFTNTGTNTGPGPGPGPPPDLHRSVEYFGPLTVGSSLTFNLAHIPLGDVEVFYDGQRKFKNVHYSQFENTISFEGFAPISGDRVICEYWWSDTMVLNDVFRIVEYTSILASHPHTFNLLYPPFGDVQLYLAGLRKFKGLHFTQGIQSVAFVPSISFVDGDLIICEYWYTSPYGGGSLPPVEDVVGALKFNDVNNSGLEFFLWKI